MGFFCRKKVTFAVKSDTLFYNIQLPDNKSLRIRQMIFSWVLCGKVPPITGRDCHDVCVVHRVLCAIDGALHTFSEQPCVIDVEDCGAAYRFLMPLLAATPGHWLLTGIPRLLQRPILPLVNALRSIGAEIRKADVGWLIYGKKLEAKEMEVDAQQSSQMASALVLSAPLFGLRTLHLTPVTIPSLSYLRMTMACTREYPVLIHGVELPDSPMGALGDWSAALFWFAHACLHPENCYRLSELTIESIQGDSVICQWFRNMNVNISADGLGIGLQATPLEKLPEMVLDVRDCLDTVPVMAALAALLPADFTFLHVRNLQYKESDRLGVLAEQLRPYAEVVLEEDMLRVRGFGHRPAAVGRFDTHHDHRLAMAFLLFGSPELLTDTDCLRKSYPELLQELVQY